MEHLMIDGAIGHPFNAAMVLREAGPETPANVEARIARLNAELKAAYGDLDVAYMRQACTPLPKHRLST